MSKPQNPKFTRNYGMFVFSKMNRPVTQNLRLERSMEEHGFQPWQHINVEKIAGGKFRVMQGHHRLKAAEKMGVGVWYYTVPVGKNKMSLFEEEATRKTWSLEHWVAGFARSGLEDYKELVNYRKDTGIPMSLVASLFNGKTTGASEGEKIKTGRYRVTDRETPAIMRRVSAAAGPKLGKSGAFVGNVAKIYVMVKPFDIEVFIRQLARPATSAMLRENARTYEMLDLITRIYNCHQSKKLSLDSLLATAEFDAAEWGRTRQKDKAVAAKRHARITYANTTEVLAAGK